MGKRDKAAKRSALRAQEKDKLDRLKAERKAAKRQRRAELRAATPTVNGRTGDITGLGENGNVLDGFGTVESYVEKITHADAEAAVGLALTTVIPPMEDCTIKPDGLADRALSMSKDDARALCAEHGIKTTTKTTKRQMFDALRALDAVG